MPNKHNLSPQGENQKPIQSIQSVRKNDAIDVSPIESVFVPHSVTRERMRRFLKAYEQHCGNVSAACATAGVKRAAYYRWMSSHTKMCRDFRVRLARIRPEERLKDKLECAASILIEEAHPQFVMFALKTKARDRGWSERVEPQPVEDALDKELKPLVDRIDQRARQMGRTWSEECLVFLDVFKPGLRPEVAERLEEMIDLNKR